jgi:hypothetical protein
MLETLVAVFAVAALGALGIAAFVVVNAMRKYDTLVKANSSVSESAANYAITLEAHVARRIAMINETTVKPAQQERARAKVAKVGDDPDQFGDEPNLIDERHMAEAEQLEQEAHPNDRFRRDYPADGLAVQR